MSAIDEELTTVSGMWIYQYQTMLSALYPERPRPAQRLLRQGDGRARALLQSEFGLNPTDQVDAETWDVLRGRACRLFNW